jgi:hypothetical protein
VLSNLIDYSAGEYPGLQVDPDACGHPVAFDVTGRRSASAFLPSAYAAAVATPLTSKPSPCANDGGGPKGNCMVVGHSLTFEVRGTAFRP